MKRLIYVLMALALAFAVLPALPVAAQTDTTVRRLEEYNANLPKGYGVIAVEDLAAMLAERQPLLLDVREVNEYEAGHLENSFNVPIRELAKNLNLLPDLNAEIVVICKGGGRATLAMAALQILGYTKATTLKGGYDAWAGEELPTTTEPYKPEAGKAPEFDAELLALVDNFLSTLPKGYGLVAPKDLAAELVDQAPILIDVRNDVEWATGYIAGAQHMWINDFMKLRDKLPQDKNARIVVYCGVGYRGGIAKVMLALLGYTDVRNLAGGLSAWVSQGLPLEGMTAKAEAFDLDQYLADYLKAQPETFGAVRAADLAKELETNKDLLLVDVRTVDEYAEGFIAGAINIPLNELTKHLDMLPDLNREMVIYCGSGHRSAIAMTALQLLGYKNVRSLLGGTTSWKAGEFALTDEPVTAEPGKAPEFKADLFKLVDAYITAIPKGYNAVKPQDLSVALAEQKPFLLDVRTEGEWAGGHIEGAVHLPLASLMTRAAELPTDKAAAIFVYDNPTHRSSMAMVLLGLRGYTNVKVLGGGFGAWQKAELPVVK